MRSVWFGGDQNYLGDNLYRQVNTGLGGSWLASEAQAQTPISEAVTITGFYMYLDTPPGAGTSWTVYMRDDGADTAVAVTIANSATSGSWAGAVTIAIDSLVNLRAAASGAPASGVANWWYITYETTGTSFVSMGGSYVNVATGATNYMILESTNATPTATAASFEIPWPMGATLTALSASSPAGSPGSGKSYAVSIRNNTTTTDLLTATISNTATAAQATGSVSVSAGDCLVIKIVPSGTPTARTIKVGASFTPNTAGESAFGYASTSAPSTSATQYDQIVSDGGGWNANEAARALSDFPPFTIRNLYWKLATAPGTGKSRTLTARDAGADTALTSTISGTSTTGNDTTHSFTGSMSTTISSWKLAPASTPAASAGVKIGYVVYIAPSRVRLRVSGTFVEKSVQARISGTFVEKPTKPRVGGSFV